LGSSRLESLESSICVDVGIGLKPVAIIAPADVVLVRDPCQLIRAETVLYIGSIPFRSFSDYLEVGVERVDLREGVVLGNPQARLRLGGRLRKPGKLLGSEAFRENGLPLKHNWSVLVEMPGMVRGQRSRLKLLGVDDGHDCFGAVLGILPLVAGI
jgi:hypothetical protein